MKRYAWMWPTAAAALAFGLLTWLDSLKPIALWDEGLSVRLQGPEVFALTVIGSGIDWLFSGPVILVATLVGAVLLWLLKRRQSAVALCAILPVIAVEVLLKYTLRHPAPFGILARRTLLHGSVGPSFLQFSFPSGHAARSSFVFLWTVFWLIGRRSWALSLGVAMALMAFVGWMLIYAGDHWLLDVIAGFLLAGFFAGATGVVRTGWLSIWLGRSEPGTLTSG